MRAETPSGATLRRTPFKEYRNQTRNVRDVYWLSKAIAVSLALTLTLH
jgi:hypothetical protein